MDMKSHFYQLSDLLLAELDHNEAANIGFSGEKSQFMRFNNARVRQSGFVDDGYLIVNLFADGKKASLTFPCSGNMEQDRKEALEQLTILRQEIATLPPDPFAVLPAAHGSSETEFTGTLPDEHDVADFLLDPVKGNDLTGIYSGGKAMRGIVNSAGTRHWFSTESFTVDFSLINPGEKMVKGQITGSDWDQPLYEARIDDYISRLKALDKDAVTVDPGKYRVYFAPAAVADLLHMFNWNGISEAAVRQGNSALKKLRDSSGTLSPLFSLKENFDLGLVPGFNGLGQISETEIPLFTDGKFVSALVNSRTAREYSLKDNAANDAESMRSPELMTGSLKQENILKELGNGLFISNLHYLNWSDLAGGRITGMTRYACFLVKDGVITAPIKNMRFDETLYHFFGDRLAAFTDFSEIIPETSTYFRRELGGVKVPGMLVDDFTFNL